MNRFFFASTLAVLGMAACLPVQAHITLEHQTALAGSFYKANFRVGHGCGESPIRQIVVHMPEGVRGAKPMPKPGWRIDIERASLAQPYLDHGRRITEDVVRIRWTARTPEDELPNTHYDEFALQARLPAREGPLYWSVSQVCAHEQIDWNETPASGQSLHRLKSPAALLDLLPSSGAHSH